MRFELFIRSIGQEYCDRELENDSELFNYNNGGHRQRIYPPSPHEEGSVLKNVRVRSEAFGGLLYDMDSKAVFSMDHEAMEAIRALLDGETFETLADRPEFADKRIEPLRESLIKYGLCSN